jgi:zincin-like metallopeptidase
MLGPCFEICFLSLERKAPGGEPHCLDWSKFRVELLYAVSGELARISHAPSGVWRSNPLNRSFTHLDLTPEIRADHAAYVASWIKVLKDNNRAISPRRRMRSARWTSCTVCRPPPAQANQANAACVKCDQAFNAS